MAASKIVNQLIAERNAMAKEINELNEQKKPYETAIGNYENLIDEYRKTLKEIDKRVMELKERYEAKGDLLRPLMIES